LVAKREIQRIHLNVVMSLHLFSPFFSG
jgi:hypothetical protein